SDRRSSVNASAPLTPTTRSASKRQNTRRGDFPPSDDVGKLAVPGVECLPRLGEIGLLDVVPGGHGISRVIQRSANDLLAESTRSEARADGPAKSAIYPCIYWLFWCRGRE